VSHLPTVKFSKRISDPVEALRLLIFGGKPIYIAESDKLIKLSFRSPHHFIVTIWQENNPIVSSVSTIDFNEIAHFFKEGHIFLVAE